MFVAHPSFPTIQSLLPSISIQSNKYSPFLDARPPFRARISCRRPPPRISAGSGKNSELEMEVSGSEEEAIEDETDYSWRGGGFGEKDYDKDPEFAEILGACLDDPDKARSKLEERLRRKRNKILHTKMGSASPMKVTFNKFDFSNSYIWLEFYIAPLEKDVTLLCDAIRAWHIIGRLGGCNSMNMQLSQAPLENRPSYDAIQGANVTPATFYNISDLEIQDNLARIWVDIGTNEPLLLDVLINALTQLSSDYVGIKHVTFGGSEHENWKENLKTEEVGYSVHRI
ncbi:uncharacterized protein LOC127240010 [Andrographis paniculata]|uniref:uncharacterized protein LOC127240010 n=1 Tax=Andrographis paniculata TaxID=175694 RepID=UPI0021E8E5FE|nr:uncharacterized protein LOC127240010 [Andrographis paniculata]